MADPAPPAGFWSRATLALAFVLYGWSMLAIELYLRVAQPATGAARALAHFRRAVMGRGVVGLGAAAVLAGIILALLARRHPAARAAALLLAAGWVACLISIWPI